MPSFRVEGASHFVQVRDANRTLLEKALRLRAMSYLADVKSALLVRTITTVGESKRFTNDVNLRLRATLEQLEHEINSRELAETDLRRITEVVDRAPLMIAIYQAGARVYANPAFVAAFAVETEGGLAQDRPRCVDDNDDARLQAALLGGEVFAEEVQLCTRDRPMWGRVRVSHDGAGGVAMFVEDVGKEREAAEQLRRAQRLEAIGRLTGGIAHDFNNVLSVILANAELLQDEAITLDTRSVRELGRLIGEVVRGASSLTRQLLSFGRRQSLNPVPVDVSMLLARLVKMLGRTLGPRFPVDLEVGEGGTTVLCDPGQLEAAVLNLVLNARDASEPKGTIHIHIETRSCDSVQRCGSGPLQPGRYLRIRVRDHGAGIEPELLERIWEPFVSTKVSKGHSGLGLSMVGGFALQSGGGVDIQSELGRGTCVTLVLPVTD